MVSYLNIVSGMEKKNKNDNHNNNHNNKRRLSSNSQLAPICSICKSNNNQIITDSESGELICSKCGQVISDKVEQEGPEWRNFDLLSPGSSGGQSNGSSTNSRSRVGMSTSLARHDMGLS